MHKAAHGIDQSRRRRVFGQSTLILDIAAVVGSLCLVSSLTFIGGGLSPAHALTAAGVVLLLAALIMARFKGMRARQECNRQNATRNLGEHMVHRIEQLKDVHWELSENEQRLRAVLDAQGDIILRRDIEGRLTFVNKAFTRVFGVEASSVLGSTFEPEVLACDAGDSEMGYRTEAGIEPPLLIATSMGPRWIAWSQQRVPGAGTEMELQISGRDVTGARAADLALKEARDQAEEGSRAKSRLCVA